MSSKRPVDYSCAIRLTETSEELVVSGNTIVGFSRSWVTNPREVPSLGLYVLPSDRHTRLQCEILTVGSNVACFDFFDELKAQRKADKKAAKRERKRLQAESLAQTTNVRMRLDEAGLSISSTPDSGIRSGDLSMNSASSSRKNTTSTTFIFESPTRSKSQIPSGRKAASIGVEDKSELQKVHEQLEMLKGEFASLKNALVDKSLTGQVKFTPLTKIPYTNQQVMASCAQGASGEALLNMLQASLKDKLSCITIGEDTWTNIPKAIQDQITELFGVIARGELIRRGEDLRHIKDEVDALLRRFKALLNNRKYAVNHPPAIKRRRSTGDGASPAKKAKKSRSSKGSKTTQKERINGFSSLTLNKFKAAEEAKKHDQTIDPFGKNRSQGRAALFMDEDSNDNRPTKKNKKNNAESQDDSTDYFVPRSPHYSEAGSASPGGMSTIPESPMGGGSQRGDDSDSEEAPTIVLETDEVTPDIFDTQDATQDFFGTQQSFSTQLPKSIQRSRRENIRLPSRYRDTPSDSSSGSDND